MDGIININKERGFTSHDVVAKLRGILGIRKIGHTGTLDPDATGVLPVCVGRATKVCDVLTDRDKTYEAKVVLGITTDTLDTSGEIREIKAVNVDRDGLTAVLSHFKGEITQIPPMYSAVKINGKKLYEYAREGKEIERKERHVTIYELELLGDDLFSWEPDKSGSVQADLSVKTNPDKHGKVDLSGSDMGIDVDRLPSFYIRIRCSKGTYIRTLCDDIGRELGCGACMASLVRTAVGRFGIDEALTLSEVEERVKSHRDETDRCDDSDKVMHDWILPVDRVFDGYPGMQVVEDGMKLLVNGNPLPDRLLQDYRKSDPAGDDQIAAVEDSSLYIQDGSREKKNGNLVRIYGSDGDFYALYRYEKGRNIYKVEKYFH